MREEDGRRAEIVATTSLCRARVESISLTLAIGLFYTSCHRSATYACHYDHTRDDAVCFRSLYTCILIYF